MFKQRLKQFLVTSLTAVMFVTNCVPVSATMFNDTDTTIDILKSADTFKSGVTYTITDSISTPTNSSDASTIYDLSDDTVDYYVISIKNSNEGNYIESGTPDEWNGDLIFPVNHDNGTLSFTLPDEYGLYTFLNTWDLYGDTSYRLLYFYGISDNLNYSDSIKVGDTLKAGQTYSFNYSYDNDGNYVDPYCYSNDGYSDVDQVSSGKAYKIKLLDADGNVLTGYERDYGDGYVVSSDYDDIQGLTETKNYCYVVYTYTVPTYNTAAEVSTFSLARAGSSNEEEDEYVITSIECVEPDYVNVHQNTVYITAQASESHTHSESTRKEDEVSPNCTKEGSYNLVTYCMECGDVISSESKTVDALGHDWTGEWVKVSKDTVTENFINNAENDVDFASIGAYDTVYKKDCLRNDAYEVKVVAHTHTPDDGKKENEVSSTCTKKGSYDWVVRCKACGDIISSDTQEVAALGHTWADDDWVTVSANDITQDYLDGAENGSNIDISKIGEYDQIYEHLCSRAQDAYELKVVPHTHDDGETKKENEVNPKCTLDGSYDLVTRCKGCGQVLKTEHITVNALGHTWHEDDWVLVDSDNVDENLINRAENAADIDFSSIGKHDVVYKRLCNRAQDAYQVKISNHKHTPDDGTKENEIKPTCTKDGSYDLVIRCTECNDVLDKKHVVVNALGHIWDNNNWTLVNMAEVTEALIQNADNASDLDFSSIDENSKVYKRLCSRAGDAYGIMISNHKHTPDDGTKENEIKPTCTKEGSYDFVVRCTVCKTVLSTEHVTVEALGHIWHDDDWTVVKKSDVTLDFINGAENADDYSFYLITKTDVVYKRLCDRAQDAYEIKVEKGRDEVKLLIVEDEPEPEKTVSNNTITKVIISPQTGVYEEESSKLPYIMISVFLLMIFSMGIVNVVYDRLETNKDE